MENLVERSNRHDGLILLIFLNAFDGIATYVGLRLGFYIELNKFLDLVYEYSSSMFIIVKIIIPTLILLILMEKIKVKISKFTKTLICLTNIIYIGIFIYHVCLYILAISLAV